MFKRVLERVSEVLRARRENSKIKAEIRGLTRKIKYRIVSFKIGDLEMRDFNHPRITVAYRYTLDNQLYERAEKIDLATLVSEKYTRVLLSQSLYVELVAKCLRGDFNRKIKATILETVKNEALLKQYTTMSNHINARSTINDHIISTTATSEPEPEPVNLTKALSSFNLAMTKLSSIFDKQDR